MTQEQANRKLFTAVETKRDLTMVKELIEIHGADPNAMVVEGEPPRRQEYNIYISSLSEQKEIMDRLDEKRMGRLKPVQREKLTEKLRLQREINVYLITKMKTCSPDGKNTILEHLLYMDMSVGVVDEFILDLVDMGYDLKNDRGIYEYLGLLALPTAEKLLNLIGYDDGVSLTSAAVYQNTELLDFLLQKGMSVNTARSDYGGKTVTYPLHAIAADNFFDRLTENVKKLIAHGADKTLKDGEGKTAFELADEFTKWLRLELPEEVVNLLK